MKMRLFNPCVLGLVLAIAASAVMAAGVVGRVTGVERLENRIEIDGDSYRMPESVGDGEGGRTYLADLRYGQAVLFRERDGEIRTLSIFKEGEVDLPPLR